MTLTSRRNAFGFNNFLTRHDRRRLPCARRPPPRSKQSGVPAPRGKGFRTRVWMSLRLCPRIDPVSTTRLVPSCGSQISHREDLWARRKMVVVSTALPDQIQEEHQRLRREHEQLMQRLDELHGQPFDIYAHRQFIAALAAHLAALQAHSANIHRERERLDQQRAIFEAQKPRDKPTQRRRPTRPKLVQRKARRP